MAKNKTTYICKECGAVSGKWSGQCMDCNAWGSVEEQVSLSDSRFSKANVGNSGKKIEFQKLDGQAEPALRKLTKIGEMDRVLGGGLVQGSAILVGGDPGIGKSTVLLQLLANLSGQGNKCVYITGEESIEQVRLRAKRLGVENASIELAAVTSVNDILASLKGNPPDILVIDSIQTMFMDNIESAPGTVSQVRMSALELINLAKTGKTSLILVGHVTKDGQIAGPKVLEHMVDTVLYFEGDRGDQFRILRSVKNRFGAANEIGVFEMTSKGLAEVENPSSLFISGKAGHVSGSVVFAGIEGTRPILVEIQALVSPSQMAMPRRTVVGWDSNRLAMILAILQTRCGMKLMDKEVYLNVAGGFKISEPAADLAVAAAIVSALTNIPIAADGVVFGEVGLSGEVRPVSQSDVRVKEADKLGFSHAVLPTGSKTNNKNFIAKEIKYISEIRNMFRSELETETIV